MSHRISVARAEGSEKDFIGRIDKAHKPRRINENERSTRAETKNASDYEMVREINEIPVITRNRLRTNNHEAAANQSGETVENSDDAANGGGEMVAQEDQSVSPEELAAFKAKFRAKTEGTN